MAARNATTRCFVAREGREPLADWIGKSTHMTAVMLIGIFAYTERCRACAMTRLLSLLFS